MLTLRRAPKVNRKQDIWKSDSIESALESLLKKNQHQDLLHFTKIRKYWNLIIGEQLFEKIKPQKLVQKTLYILVEDAAYAHHMKYYEKSMLDLIATPEICGESIVSKIIFRVGKLPATLDQKLPAQTAKSSATEKKSTHEVATPQEVTSTAKIIGNPELRERFSKLMKRIILNNPEKTK